MIDMHDLALSMNCFFQRIFKRQAVVLFSIIGMITCLFAEMQNITQKKLLSKEQFDHNTSFVFIGKSSQGTLGLYESMIPLLHSMEDVRGIKIMPENFPKIIIKLDTSAAPGLHPSSNLVDATLEFLRQRGYSKDRVDLLCFNFDELVRSKAYGLQSKNRKYKGHKIQTPVDEGFFTSEWFHDSSMPPQVHDRAKFFLEFPHDLSKRMEEERKSYIPAALLDAQTYWINLAVVMDDTKLGITGAASNMSLDLVSNSKRFRQDSTLGAAAITEILAIPEIWGKRLFSMVDLHRYQFAGGSDFNAEFIDSSPILLVSQNPFSVDSIAWKYIAKSREMRKLSSRSKEEALIFKYAESLNLGRVVEPKVIKSFLANQ